MWQLQYTLKFMNMYAAEPPGRVSHRVALGDGTKRRGWGSSGADQCAASLVSVGVVCGQRINSWLLLASSSYNMSIVVIVERKGRVLWLASSFAP
jgi:hypothetical protein